MFKLRNQKIFGKARGVNEPIEKKHKDIAASLQKGFEEIIIKKLISIKKKYNHDNLCLAGGCAFNSSLNGVIIKETNFKNIYLSPNVGDAGGALGAALYIAKKNNEKLSYNSSPYLGTYYDNKYVEEKVINKIKNMKHIKYKYYENFDELNHQVVKKLSNGCVVGWFQYKMEW